MNREAWLNRVVRALRPRFRAAGYPIPVRVAVSCGWPSQGGLAKNANEAEFWSARQSPDGTAQIFISPTLTDSLEVAEATAHECLHAALDALEQANPHDVEFQRAMPAIGLKGKPTATHATRELKRELVLIVERIGAYPHAGLNP